MKPSIPLFVGLALLIGSAACGVSETPISPTAAGTTVTEQLGAGTLVGLQGIIRGIDRTDRTFVLHTRDGLRQIVTDGDTQIWDAGREVGFAALREGLRVGVRGVDLGRSVIARSVGVLP